MKSASQSERSIVLFDKVKTNIDIVAYFAQISINRRLQHVNQAGAALINDRDLWKQFRQNLLHGKMAVMGSAFKVQYRMIQKDENDLDMVKLVNQFQADYDLHTLEEPGLLKEEIPAVISFDKIQASPEWWIKQMKVGTWSSNEPNPIFSEHGYW